MTAPTLIFGWGNPGRGDDAIGPLFVERFRELAAVHPEWGSIEYLTDFQLQPEHVLDLRDRQRVLFVDASLTAAPPFTLQRIVPARDVSFTSHAMSPQALLQAWCGIETQPPPPCWLLAIRGECFELGATPGDAALAYLATALDRVQDWLTASA